ALFKAGKFEEAESSYKAIAAQEPRNLAVLVGLGRIALFSNRQKEAEEWLKKAIEIEPKSRSANLLRAEVFTRQDEFQRAAASMRVVGQDERAARLETFKGAASYQIEGTGESTSLPFVLTDPLPLVRVRVNGSPEANFLLDTGAAEVMLDPDFAKEIG